MGWRGIARPCQRDNQIKKIKLLETRNIHTPARRARLLNRLLMIRLAPVDDAEAIEEEGKVGSATQHRKPRRTTFAKSTFFVEYYKNISFSKAMYLYGKYGLARSTINSSWPSYLGSRKVPPNTQHDSS